MVARYSQSQAQTTNVMSPVRNYLSRCRKFFIYAGIFSFVINVLTLAPAFYMLELYDRVLSSYSNETLVMLTILVAFMIAIQYYLEYIRAHLFLRTSLTMQKMMQRGVLDCMLRVSPQGISNRHGLDDVHALQAFFSGPGLQAIFELPWVPIFLLVMYLFHPLLCLLACIGVLILVALTFLEEKLSAQNQKAGQVALRKSQDFLDAALKNIGVINALSMHDVITGRWHKIHDQALSNTVLAATKSVAVSHWSKYVRNLLTILAMGLAAYLAINDRTVTPGVMIASTIIIGRLMAPVDRLISSWKSFVKARDAYGRLNTMLASYHPWSGHITLRNVEGNLSVEKLFFAISKEREILRNIHFSVIAGESLGIIGNSAAGKSTLTRLLVGLDKPTSGAVRIDGADVYQWSSTGSLGSHIGYMPQSVELFIGTVAENIARMGDPFAHIEAVIESAKLVGAHDFILRLPQGYDTEIGEAGSLLSAGQRQLVGLARALFGKPKFVVLDEPNANLDGPSELRFMRMIRELKQHKVTLVIVSHKPSILRDVDKVLVLEQGRQLHFGDREMVMQHLNANIDSGNATQVSLVKGTTV
jgi:PrtD family type I secretion system ABC transporter